MDSRTGRAAWHEPPFSPLVFVPNRVRLTASISGAPVLAAYGAEIPESRAVAVSVGKRHYMDDLGPLLRTDGESTRATTSDARIHWAWSRLPYGIGIGADPRAHGAVVPCRAVDAL